MTELIEHDFMRKALIGLALLAPMCAMLGVQVVNFRMAYFADAVSHSALAGVALGMLLGVPPVSAMLAFGVLIAWLVQKLKKGSALSSDTVIGVISAGAIALGLVLAPPQNLGRSFEPILFGKDVLILTADDLTAIGVLFGAVLVFEAVAFNALLLMGIDVGFAQAQGIRASLIERIFITLLALVVLTAVYFVGLLLVTAMLIIPAATARNVARSAAGLFWWAIAVALGCSISGLAISFYADVKTGAAVVLLCAVAFAASLIYRRVAGLNPAKP